MAYELPPLNYDYNAFEPLIDAQTMEIHHTRHHKTYVDKTNAAIEEYPQLAAKDIDELISELNEVPESIRTAVRNNAGGHANHTFFWKILSPAGGGKLHGSLESAIDQAFGSFDNFKTQFTEAAINRFGNGWAWLCLNENQSLEISSTSNQDSPLMKGTVYAPGHPIIGLDVWEHAYYLTYQNKRPAYVEAFWKLVNWNQAEKNYTTVLRT
ncbi:MAG: superoxide dismutase [Opitutales bacterium]